MGGDNSWRLQFHNSELYFRSRAPNLCSHRRCERDFVLFPTHFYHATTLQLCAFARHSASWPAGPMTIRHFDFSIFVFNRGDLYYLGYKKYNIWLSNYLKQVKLKENILYRLASCRATLPCVAGLSSATEIWPRTVAARNGNWEVKPCS